MNELTPWEGIGNRSVRTDRLAARGRETLGLLRKLGIDVQPNNRIDRAANLLDEVDQNIRRGIDIAPQDTVRQAMMVEAQRTLIDAVTIVHARISRATGEATIGTEHLKALLSGPDLPSAAGDSSRNFQFEARVGALLVFAGLAVRRGEPDFVFEMGGFSLGVAVKRMTSSGATALSKRVREGVRQLAAARMHGFIAVDVDSWPADELGGLEATDFGTQFERELAAARDVVTQSSFNERVIGAYFADSDHVFRSKSISRFAPCRSPGSVDADQG